MQPMDRRGYGTSVIGKSVCWNIEAVDRKMDINKIDNLPQTKSQSTKKINKKNGFDQIFDQKLAGIKASAPQAPVRTTENKIKIVLSGMDERMKDLNAELAEFRSEIEAELEALERRDGGVQGSDVPLPDP